MDTSGALAAMVFLGLCGVKTYSFSVFFLFVVLRTKPYTS